MDFKLTTIGTSAAGPVPGRWASSLWLKVGKCGILIDCAEGTQIAMQELRIGWGSVDIILISHLHGDHIYGLPGLLTSWALNNRNRPLHIFGPEGLKTWLELTFSISHTGLPYPVEWHVVEPKSAPKEIFSNKVLSIKSIPLAHRVPTQGFLIKEHPRQPNIIPKAIEKYAIPHSAIRSIKAGEDFITTSGEKIPAILLTHPPASPRSFAYCSDTAYNPSLVPLLNEVDILYHEATFMADMVDQAKITGHSTSVQAAQIALEAQVGQLVLGHFSPRYGDLEPLLREAKSIFPATTLAEAGKVFEKSLPKRQA